MSLLHNPLISIGYINLLKIESALQICEPALRAGSFANDPIHVEYSIENTIQLTAVGLHPIYAFQIT